MGLSEHLHTVDQHLATAGAAVPVDERAAFRLMDQCTGALDAALTQTEKSAISTQLMRDAIEEACHSFVEKDVNLGVFVFNDRSILAFYGETNHAYAVSRFNDESKKLIHQWMLAQGFDMSGIW